MLDCLLYRLPVSVVWTTHIEQNDARQVFDLLDLVSDERGPETRQMSLSVFTLCYAILVVCFVFRTKEFVSAGLTIEIIFERYLRKESDNFLAYHARRNYATQFVHSCLIPVYLLSLYWYYDVAIFALTSVWWTAIVGFFFIHPLLIVLFWSWNPLSKNLEIFATEQQTWQDVESQINDEFNSIDKVCIRNSSLTTIVATTHWLVKLAPYTVDVVHQNYAEVIVNHVDTFHRSADDNAMVQFINIQVRCTRPGVKPFGFRMNAMDFADLQAKMRSNIIILDGVHFRKNTMEQFLEVFSETVNKNLPYEISRESEVEKCIGCLQQPAGVKLFKTCTGSELCKKCECRPFWCMDCMGKWFAARQDHQAPETWLSSTCTCPICRSVFCILDVCPLKIQDSQ